jgi:hypothetical protein
VKFHDHPSTHGHHVNPQTCSAVQNLHWACEGFSGGYDTYLCGCCCHDLNHELTDQQQAIVQRLRSRPA